MDEPLIPYWTRYTPLSRFFNMTDLARERISEQIDAELEAMTNE